MILILDLQMNNQNSVYKIINNKLGYSNVKISNHFQDIEKSSGMILPGIGSFDYTMKQIKKFNLSEILKNQVIDKKKIILGICVGMQILFERSDEGNELGLGWLKGNVEKLNNKKNKLNIKIPHIGWNSITIRKKHPILRNLTNESIFYFAHSYHATSTENVIANTEYGINFPSIVNDNNIFGCQFHPEKSHSNGKKILENFISLI